MQAKDSLGKRPTFHPKRTWIVPLFLLGVAAAHFTGGAYWLWLHAQTRTPESFRAGAGLLLVLLALVQMRVVQVTWRDRCGADPFGMIRGRLFWRWLACGFVICYGIALFTGARHSALVFFWPAVGAWYTFAQVVLVGRPRAVEPLLVLFERRQTKAIGWTVYMLVMLPLGAEAVLRIYTLVVNDPMTVAYVTDQLKLTPGSELRGQQINDCGYWDDPFDVKIAPGRFRVAAVGDDVTLCGNRYTNFLARMERFLPQLEVYNFGIPKAGPEQYAAQIACEVAPYQPDLVLIFFSVDTDVTHEVPLPGAFQWEGLHLVQFSSRLGGGSANKVGQKETLSERSVKQTEYLRQCTTGLSVCRTPMDDRMRDRWREVFDHLNASIEACRSRNLTPALVVVPSPFQVNPGLCEVLCRRAGYERGQLDLELPQRRLAQYAKDHDLPMLDLLPILRSSRRPTYVRNHRLLNDRGNVIASEVIGAWLTRRYGNRLGEARLAGR